ncbi:Enzymatic polyprotein [Tetrabaena socialis]|uniref:Enzymatic polyprotein n=1 Tax=Tetrabaena socialis TaxID=47790 RepID=A0A2J7ZKD4_9CHLO|nr:Enzymatic polyprotein [Tetrabaena socialis]|eukprot:PNH00721.1 Enzymatic polyprotein [Tetrabaena socialis]
MLGKAHTPAPYAQEEGPDAAGFSGPLQDVLEASAAAAAAAVMAAAAAAVAAAAVTSLEEPPAPVRLWFGPGGCKLNTDAWQSRGFDSAAIRNEATWCFNVEPAPSHDLRNYPTIAPHRDAMGAHFDALLASGVTEQYSAEAHGSEADFAAVISPLHVVLKADGDIRPIIDPTRSGVNACMTHLPCQLPDLATILQNLPEGGYLGKRDLASGFHQVKLAPEARRYMAFRHPTSNALQRWVALPFGASQCPPIFVELTAASTTIFQAECDRLGLAVRIYTYVDDYMLLGATHADVAGAFEVLDRVGAELGLEWKLSKDRGRHEQLQQLEFLGMLFDTVRMEMRIAPDKRQRYAAGVRALLDGAVAGAVPRTDLETAVGRLTFVARACRWGYTFLQGLYDSLFSPQQPAPPTVQLSAEAQGDLAFWWGVLRSGSSVWDGVKRCALADMDLVRGTFAGPNGAIIFTDASGAGFGAAWGAAEIQGSWSQQEKQLHIAWLELKAVLRAVQSWAPQLAGRRVLIRCDNTQAVAAINHGSTRVRDGRSISQQLAELSIQHGFELRSEHIAGVENVRADRLSRQLSSAREQNLPLKSCVFRQLVGSGPYQPSVDCCCDVHGQNAQPGCSIFFSAERSVVGQAAALAGKVLWAFPPQDLVGAVLDEIAAAARLDSRTRTTVLVPDWRERAWFRQHPQCGEAQSQAAAWCAGGRAAAMTSAVRAAQCAGCVLAAAGLGQQQQQGPVGDLAASWVELAGSAVGKSSAVTYASARQRYSRFCIEVAGVAEEDVFPRRRGSDVNHALVCLFITHAMARLAKSTVEGTLSALADWQRSRGLPTEASISADPMVKRTLGQALRRKADLEAAAATPAAAREKAPLPVTLLRLLVGWLQLRIDAQPARAREYVQDGCWLVLGFFGMLRRSELAALAIGDVRPVATGGLVLTIRRSKSDQLAAGATVCLAEMTGSGFPIGRILRQHVALSAGAGGEQPLFAQGAQWPGGCGVGWRREDFTARLRELLSELAQDRPERPFDLTRVSAHSLRRGGATAAAEAGVPLKAIMEHGRWRSSAVLVYIRKSVRARMALVGRM